jgi:hypothetical protein
MATVQFSLHYRLDVDTVNKILNDANIVYEVASDTHYFVDSKDMRKTAQLLKESDVAFSVYNPRLTLEDKIAALVSKGFTITINHERYSNYSVVFMNASTENVFSYPKEVTVKEAINRAYKLYCK